MITWESIEKIIGPYFKKSTLDVLNSNDLWNRIISKSINETTKDLQDTAKYNDIMYESGDNSIILLNFLHGNGIDYEDTLDAFNLSDKTNLICLIEGHIYSLLYDIKDEILVDFYLERLVKEDNYSQIGQPEKLTSVPSNSDSSYSVNRMLDYIDKNHLLGSYLWEPLFRKKILLRGQDEDPLSIKSVSVLTELNAAFSSFLIYFRQYDPETDKYRRPQNGKYDVEKIISSYCYALTKLSEKDEYGFKNVNENATDVSVILLRYYLERLYMFKTITGIYQIADYYDNHHPEINNILNLFFRTCLAYPFQCQQRERLSYCISLINYLLAERVSNPVVLQIMHNQLINLKHNFILTHVYTHNIRGIIENTLLILIEERGVEEVYQQIEKYITNNKDIEKMLSSFPIFSDITHRVEFDKLSYKDCYEKLSKHNNRKVLDHLNLNYRNILEPIAYPYTVEEMTYLDYKADDRFMSDNVRYFTN